MIIRGIILAGGTSSRMGKNKLQLEFNGQGILKNVIDNAKASALDDIVVVYGKYDVETDIKKIYNPDFEKGMSTTIIRGLAGWDGDGVMLLLGDMPLIDSKIINTLCDAFKSSPKGIVVPRSGDRRGNPVIIGRKYYEDLLNNQGDKGARDIIKNNPLDIQWVDIESEAIFIDVDDDEAYGKIIKAGNANG